MGPNGETLLHPLATATAVLAGVGRWHRYDSTASAADVADNLVGNSADSLWRAPRIPSTLDRSRHRLSSLALTCRARHSNRASDHCPVASQFRQMNSVRRVLFLGSWTETGKEEQHHDL